MSLKTPQNLKKMLEKSSAANARALFLKTLIFPRTLLEFSYLKLFFLIKQM